MDPLAPKRRVAIEHVLLAALFALSGAAALVYEVTWFQALALVVGSNAAAMAVVLGVFMAGMCVGSLWLPRKLRADVHPLRTYAKLELAVAISGALVPVVLPWAGALYVRIGVAGSLGLAVRAALCGALLLPPTIALGATLPVVARRAGRDPEGARVVGWLYAANTLGAVAGCLLAAMLLLRLYDAYVASAVAVGLNVAAASGAMLLASRWRAADDAPSEPGSPAQRRGSVLFAMALSGATALAAEVVWTRNLALLLGATVYTFALILAAMLLGLAIGGGIGAAIARTPERARFAFGATQLSLVAALFWANWAIPASVSRWHVLPSTESTAWSLLSYDFWRCVRVTGLGALAWGASFPLGLAALADASSKLSERSVSRAYASNTLGAVIGAACASLVLVPSIGTLQTQRLCVALAALAAWITWRGPLTRQSAVAQGMQLAGIGAVAFVGMRLLQPVPAELVGFGRYANLAEADKPGHNRFVYLGEGANATIAVSRTLDGALYYHNAGKVQASTSNQDMRLQRMLGHLTTLLVAEPRNVLTIGCGAGITAGAVSVEPRLERETIVEIESLVPKAAAQFFGRQNEHVIRNPRVRVLNDDARHFLYTTNERFDAITSDPFDAWARGAAALSTREFLAEMRRHLNPGGVVTLWVPLYETTTDVVRTEIATFLDVFPDAAMFGNADNGLGYDTVLVGSAGPLRIDVDAIEARLADPQYRKVRDSLEQSGFHGATTLLATYAASGKQLARWSAGAPLNRDRDLRLQYLAGLRLDMDDPAGVYRGIVAASAWPEGLFVGSPATLDLLRDRYEHARKHTLEN